MMGWAVKALTAMRHAGRAPFFLGILARSKFDYRKEVGDGIDASVVTAPVQWVQRAFMDAPFRVLRIGDDGDQEEIERHPLAALINRPNPFYADRHLWSATLVSYLIAGNAYWLKVRSGAGRVAELWWVPHWTMAPKWPEDGSAFISHYEYTPGRGEKISIDPEDVVHFRHGIDPRNPRLGLSPLDGAIREIFMDLESSNFAASLLRNLGVPGMVLSPDGGAAASPEDVEAVKTWLREAFTGDRRGQPLVMGGATKVQQYGFNPQQMDLSATRDVAEERVCACLGIPAAVVGFGAGLQTAKVGATMDELRKLAWTNGVIPVQRSLADEIQRSLLPDFERDPDRFEAAFDAGEIIALEADLLARAQRWDAMVQGGWAQVAEAREAMGLDVDDSHRIFLRKVSVFEVPAGAEPRPPEDLDPEQAALDLRGRLKGKARRRVNRAQLAYALTLERALPGLADAFEGRLKAFFATLGAGAREASMPLLDVFLTRSLDASDKQTPEEEILVAQILDGMGTADMQVTFRQLYEAQYLGVAETVAEAGEMLGLAAILPDPVARAVVQAGGRRAGLVDLESQSRRALFDALAEGRAAGEGAETLAARIAGHVEGGPWASAETRARTIARTETKYAQNISTIARAQAEGVEQFIVFDGRLGPGRSTPSHIARDGSIVSADEAVAMANAEHPNGTLSFSPFFEEDPFDD